MVPNVLRLFYLSFLIPLWVDIAVSALHMRKLWLRLPRSTYQIGLKYSADLKPALIAKPVLLWCLYSSEMMLETLKSGSFLVHTSFAISAAPFTKDIHSTSHTQIYLRPDLSGFVYKLSYISNNARSSLQFVFCSHLKMSQNSHCPREILRMFSCVNQVYAVLSHIN